MSSEENIDNKTSSASEKRKKLNAKRQRLRELSQKNLLIDTVRVQCPACGAINSKKPFYYEYESEDSDKFVMKKYLKFDCNFCNAPFRNRIKIPKNGKKNKSDD